MSSFNLNDLIEKTTHWDKDERYMATSDLCNELEKGLDLDISMEKRICTAILRCLDDKSHDVQSIAVKCLAVLIKRIKREQLIEISTKLCDLLLNGSTELRDIYSIGLKTLISDTPDEMGQEVAINLTLPLLDGIQQDDQLDQKLECLENLRELIKRFGHQTMNNHEQILRALLGQLSQSRNVVKKRASQCLGALAVSISDTLLNELIDTLLTMINQTSRDDLHIIIQTIGNISRTVGYRLGRHLDSIVPLFIRFCGDPNNEDEQNDLNNELREHCFPGFESFLLHCPKEITQHIDSIINLSLAFMKYDPNYFYDEDDDDNNNNMDEDNNNINNNDDDDDDDDIDYDDDDDDDNWNDEFSDDENYGDSDEDDTSWKVRRSAIRVINAWINSRPDMLSNIYEKCFDELLNRFKEREESVRLDIIGCTNNILLASMGAEDKNMLIYDDNNYNNINDMNNINNININKPKLIRQRSVVNILDSKISKIINISNKYLKQNKNQKTEIAIYQLLKNLCIIHNGNLTEYFDILINQIENCLKQIESSQTLKLECLLFLRKLIILHDSNIIAPYLSRIIPLISNCSNEDWYKIIAESLRIFGVLPNSIRPDINNNNINCSLDELNIIYNSILNRLSAHDIDQEIKECALYAIGEFFSIFSDILNNELNNILNILYERLQNEITRIPTLRTLNKLTSSKLNINLNNYTIDIVKELIRFLRQANRNLRQSTLKTLISIFKSINKNNISNDIYNNIIIEISNLITDNDLYLSNLSINLIILILPLSNDACNTFANNTFNKIIILSSSSLIQGNILQSLLILYNMLPELNIKLLTYEKIFNLLKQQAFNTELNKQSALNISRCISSIFISNIISNDLKLNTIHELIEYIQNNNDNLIKQRLLGLLTIGEIGSKYDLSINYSNILDILISCFENTPEEIKSAAAFSLGRIIIGNLDYFLPNLWNLLQSTEYQYLLLSSLREIIIYFANSINIPSKDDNFNNFMNNILPHLRNYCDNNEEGIRNMVAECYGALLTIEPIPIINILKELSNINNPNIIWTIVTSLRHCLSSSKNNIIELENEMEIFLNLINIDNIDCQKASLIMITAALHHHPHLVSSSLSNIILPIIIQCLNLNLERIVDLGPFKHKVDDALPLRKVALACLDTAIDHLPEKLDLPYILNELITRLSDDDDIKINTHQIIIKICNYGPNAILISADSIVTELDKTLRKMLKKIKKSNTNERAKEMVKSILNVFITMSNISDIDSSRLFIDKYNQLLKDDYTLELIENIKSEKNNDFY